MQKTEQEIRTDERQRILQALKDNWPKKNKYPNFEVAADAEEYWRKAGQNQGRKACWIVIQRIFGVTDVPTETIPKRSDPERDAHFQKLRQALLDPSRNGRRKEPDNR